MIFQYLFQNHITKHVIDIKAKPTCKNICIRIDSKVLCKFFSKIMPMKFGTTPRTSISESKWMILGAYDARIPNLQLSSKTHG